MEKTMIVPRAAEHLASPYDPATLAKFVELATAHEPAVVWTVGISVGVAALARTVNGIDHTLMKTPQVLTHLREAIEAMAGFARWARGRWSRR
ncbi:hypothetical protein [Kitasatospora sp. NPDC059673]|uniref:hypothetical protein n=1 Tax=Kitasatospora sp. NPDC059673 TaxID=3346901 RepID=UPI0036837513